MYRPVFLAVVGAILWGACPGPAQAGFILRDVRAQEVLNPIVIYEATIVLVGEPGTFINGSSDPSRRDYFTIFDIPNLASSLSQPPGWLPSMGQDVLIPSGLPDGFNNPNLPDITYSFIAGGPIELGNRSELVIGTFRWQTFHVSPQVITPQIRYAWQTSRLVNGERVLQTGFGTAYIPEPASLAMTAAGLGLGLGLAGGLVRRRRPRMS